MSYLERKNLLFCRGHSELILRFLSRKSSESLFVGEPRCILLLLVLSTAWLARMQMRGRSVLFASAILGHEIWDEMGRNEMVRASGNLIQCKHRHEPVLGR